MLRKILIFNFILLFKSILSYNFVFLPSLNKYLRTAYSTRETLYNSYFLAKECLLNNIQGDFVECGVAGGAQIGAMYQACIDCKLFRKFHLFDSFEGIPLAGPKDTQQPGIGKIKHNVNVDPDRLLVSSGITAISLENVKKNLKSWGINFNYMNFCKGWFQKTLPSYAKNIDKIALLRLDGDLYDSTKVCLDYLYDKVVLGGYIIIDDYALTGCRRAVDEYLEKNNLKPNIIPVKGGGGPVYWRKDK